MEHALYVQTWNRHRTSVSKDNKQVNKTSRLTLYTCKYTRDVASTTIIKYKYKYKYPQLKYKCKYKYSALKYKYKY